MLDDPEFAAKVQAMPTGNGIDVAGEAAVELRSMGHHDVADDIEARIRLGEKKYGTRLKSHNGRDAMLDLYQETLDAVNYSKQLMVEGRDDGNLFLTFALLAVEIRGKLHKS